MTSFTRSKLVAAILLAGGAMATATASAEIYQMTSFDLIGDNIPVMFSGPGLAQDSDDYLFIDVISYTPDAMGVQVKVEHTSPEGPRVTFYEDLLIHFGAELTSLESNQIATGWRDFPSQTNLVSLAADFTGMIERDDAGSFTVSPDTGSDLMYGLVDRGYVGEYVLEAENTVSAWDGDVLFNGVDEIEGAGYNVTARQSVWDFNTTGGVTTVDISGSGVSIDSSAKISYLMDASATLSTRDQYRFEGTAIVPASATLEAVLNDGHAIDKAYFSAKTFDIADGATIKVDGSSADYTKPDDTTRYVIVEADTLNANLGKLNLLSEGLNDIEFDNSNNQIAVTVTAQDLTLLSGGFGDSANSQAAAGSLQSVLEATGGTATGDAYYELAKALRDQGSFEQLAPVVENTSGASIRGADAQAASHVGGLLQSYRGGASGDTPIASGLWIQGLSSSGEQDSMGDANGFDIDTSGYAIGYDAELAQGLTTGFAISYADSDVKVDNSLDRQTSDGYTGALYGQYIFDNDYYSSAILSYGQNDNDSRRWVANDYAEADFDSDILSLRLAGGKKIWVDSLLIQPLVEFNYSDIGIDSYTETGSVAALNIDDQDYKIVELGFGASISQDFEVGQTLLRPELKAAYYHDFQQDGVRITSAFTAGGNSFVTTGEDADANRYSVKAGLAWMFGDSNTLRASYDFNSSDNYTGGTWLMDYRMDF